MSNTTEDHTVTYMAIEATGIAANMFLGLFAMYGLTMLVGEHEFIYQVGTWFMIGGCIFAAAALILLIGRALWLIGHYVLQGFIADWRAE